MVKNPPANAREAKDVQGSIPGLGRPPGEGSDNPLQYSCLENPMDRGAWWATVHEVAESDMTEHARVHEADFQRSPREEFLLLTRRKRAFLLYCWEPGVTWGLCIMAGWR